MRLNPLGSIIHIATRWKKVSFGKEKLLYVGETEQGIGAPFLQGAGRLEQKQG